ncbi:MAG: TM2 domain-containing protein [Clostridia bacterium]
MKNPGKLAAILIVLFTGEFGLHKFLTGNYVMGVVYLFTCGLFGIGWLIDFIKVCRGTYVDKAGNPWGVD